jgi:chitin disaccharide deacetylase
MFSSRFLSFLLLAGAATAHAQAPAKSVQERLGYPATAKLLIIHADDFGGSHSINRATSEALEKGYITSASILVPCPWFLEAAEFAKAHPGADLGIHQALNSEWAEYRWGPVTSKDQVPSLLDAQGYLPLDTPEVAKNAKPEEVERELRAQVDRAQKMGVHITHLDSHMAALFGSTDLYKVYLKMGHSYGVPILEEWEGVHGPLGVKPPPDEMLVQKVISIDPGVPAEKWTAWYEDQLKPLGPGVYQIIVHLAFDDDEMRGIAKDHPDWGAAWRQHDFDMVKSTEFHQFLKDQGFTLVGWKDLAKALPKGYGTE